MKFRSLTILMLAAGLLGAAPALAQRQAAPQAVPPDLSAVPDKRPFNIPFGTPITMERAQGLIQAAVAEGIAGQAVSTSSLTT